MASEENDELNKKSPFAGCTILIVAGLVMLGVIAWSVYTLYYQGKEFEKFTQASAQAQPVAKIEGNEAALNDLKARINSFQADLTAKRVATLELSANDLNLGIATFDEFKELRQTFYVEEILDNHLQIGINYQLGKSPFSDRENHLVATIEAIPELHPGEIILTINKISVPDVEVPDPVLGHLSPHRITEIYKEHEILGPAMTQLTQVSITDKKIVLKSDPEATPVTTIPEDIGPSAKRALTLFGIIATVFLTGVGLILFIGHKVRRQP